jgi:hypothetical protein
MTRKQPYAWRASDASTADVIPEIKQQGPEHHQEPAFHSLILQERMDDHTLLAHLFYQ